MRSSGFVPSVFALVAMLFLSSTALAEGDPDAPPSPPPSPPSQFALHATLMRGTFATVPVTRAGLLGELRSSKLPIAGTLLIELGQTDNGLGSHRAELAFDLRTPWPIIVGSAGLHMAYAILVRTTGNDNFMRALGGDIGSFALGVHAGLEGQIPLGRSTPGENAAPMKLVIGVRGSFDLYDGAVGAMAGPQVGLVF